ncbi:hypothetical protein C9374_007228 [Naegleria lovaniensis]|uniref:TPX2 central domain-containing protein n=1 Tax=Naegleria lovaniensis TaxID=51637 RepID=A0AA88KS06_NAELO|nr:uncharacterized protein C9374_007228 [Naegleria lovaniensis]KAG2393697.1 hypothetical protein C9374_007228 [Naegleria lovaniensis]
MSNISSTNLLTTNNEEQTSLIEEEWEFKAPKYFDFDKILFSSSEDSHNKSHTDQWFFTEDAQHLEFLDPKYIDLNNQPQQQQQILFPNGAGSMMNHTDITLSNISTISKFSVHHHDDDGASLYSSGSNNIQSIQPQGTLSSSLFSNNYHSVPALASQQAHKKPTSRRPAPKLTIPQTLKFMTDQRMKQKGQMIMNPNTSKASSTTMIKTTLKVENKDLNLTKFKTITRPKLMSPKPFKFATESRAGLKNHNNNNNTSILPPGHSPFNKSMLQKINEMRTKMPSRWKCNTSVMKSSSLATPGTPLSRSKPLKITKPCSFKLRTKFRSRMRAQPAQTTLDNVVRVEFKARPLNRKIFESSGQMGLGRVVKREVTHPEQFNLRTDERIKKRKLDQSKIALDDESCSNSTMTASDCSRRPIKTRKLQDNTLNSTQSILLQTSRSVKPPTIPESPNLRTKQRAALHNRTAPQPATPNSPHITFRARPLPATTFQNSCAFVPTLNEHVTTVPEPFHLKTEERGFMYRKQFESRMIEEEEKENESRQFKARPILKSVMNGSLCDASNSSISSSVRSNITKPITIPVSPKLLTKNRARSEGDSILKSVIIGPSLPNTSTFRARPMPHFYHSNPSTSIQHKTSRNMDVTHVEPFHLRTEERGQAYQFKFKSRMEELSKMSSKEDASGLTSSFTTTRKQVSSTHTTTATTLRL